jgi:hypothetical protein
MKNFLRKIKIKIHLTPNTTTLSATLTLSKKKLLKNSSPDSLKEYFPAANVLLTLTNTLMDNFLLSTPHPHPLISTGKISTFPPHLKESEELSASYLLLLYLLHHFS